MEYILRKSSGFLGKLQGRHDPGMLQFGFGSSADTPYITNFELRKGFDALLFRPYLAYPVIARVFLGVLGCHFGERL